MDQVFRLRAVRDPSCAGETAYALCPGPDAITPLDQFLAASKIGAVDFFRARSKHPHLHQNIPWATIIWPRGYPLAGYFAELRYQAQDFRLWNIDRLRGVPFNDSQIEGIQILEFWRKPILEDIAARSPALTSAWQSLKDKPYTGFWLCLAAPPEGPWLEAACRDNKIRHRKADALKRPPASFNPAILRTPTDQLRYWTANESEASGQHESAAKLFSHLCRGYPGEARLWARKGFNLLSHNPKRAILAYKKALRLIPTWFNCKVFMASAFIRLGDLDAALPLLEDVISQAPFDRAALKYLFDVIGAKNPEACDRKQYLPLALRYVGLEPREASAWFRVGYYQSLGGNFVDAIPCFRQAVALAPQTAIYRNNLAYCMVMLGKDMPRAERLCCRAIEMDPACAHAWDTLGLIYLHRGQMNEAVTYFRRALKFSPKNVESWRHLAQTFRQLDNLPEASKAAAKADELSRTIQIEPRASKMKGPDSARSK